MEVETIKEGKTEIKVRLNTEEKEKLERDAARCGLSQAEYIRQLCRGRQPKDLPAPEFWQMMEELYRVHDFLKKHSPNVPEAEEKCREIEDLILTVMEVT